MQSSRATLANGSSDLLQELFWRSSSRIAIVDSKGRIVITSKAFRDAFPYLIEVRDSSETIRFDSLAGCEGLLDMLAKLPAGERLSHMAQAPIAGVENEVRIITSALHSTRGDMPLFLTEWIPKVDSQAFSRAMEEVEQSYRTLQENLPVGIYRGLEDGIIQTANSALIRMMRFESFEELQKARLADVWVDVRQREEMFQRLRDEGFVLGYEVLLRRADGTELAASFDARGTFDSQGRLVYFDTIVQDITERVRAQQELQLLARTDSLTGLYNRQYLMERFEEEMTRTARYDRPLSVMMIDLDHFKQVNDGYGHLAGDGVLVAAAELIDRTLRETDFVGRYGGEEFLAVLPETAMKGAMGLAERLRSSMEETSHRMPGGDDLEVTCSIGVAEALSGDVEDTIELADSAMYAAKHAGRNMVMRCQPADRN